MTAEFRRSLPATDAIPSLIEAIEAWLGEAGVPGDQAARLMVAFDEIISNIARHGRGTVEVMLGVDAGMLRATIADDGPRFDPLARPAPDVDLDIDAREIGGLGIHLVREMIDEVTYAYENGRNLLRLKQTF